MAGLRPGLAVLGAVGRCFWRELQSHKSLGGQNFFLFVLLMALQPESAAFFLLILAAIVLFSIATDPLAKLPAGRKQTWPLEPGQWTIVRLGSLLFTPLSFVAVFLAFKADWGGLLALAGVVGTRLFAGQFASRVPQFGWRAWLLRIPSLPGCFGSLMRMHWRAMAQTLDLYMACLIAMATACYGFSGHALPDRARTIIALLIVLALSTQTQVLIEMDGPGFVRYRYWPLRGWKILLAKDAASLLVLGILTSMTDPLAGIAGGAAALGVGHHRCVRPTSVQMPWRFTQGSLGLGALQIIGIFLAGMTATEVWWTGPICVGLLMLSIVVYGRMWDRTDQK